MRFRLRIGASLCALACLAGAGSSAAQGFDVTAQDRSVDVAITVAQYLCLPPPSGCTPTGSPTNHSDSESAPDTSPFDAIAEVAGFQTFHAGQVSTLSPDLIFARGAGLHTGSGGFTPPPPNLVTATSGSSDSHFEVAFDVDAPTPIRLGGSVTVTGGLSANSTARIRLRTAGGTPLAEVVAETDPDCQGGGCETVGPIPLNHTQVLAPGSYVLEASFAGSATPFFFAGNFFTLASTGEYELELAVVAIPALGPGALALLALALGLAAAPFLARAQRPSALG